MHYISSGKGQAFFFQHGLGSQLSQALTTLDGLSGVRLISADCPGHGQEILPNGHRPSFNYYADYLCQLQDQLEASPAFWGGISMGSGIALNIALRFQDRVKALVLVRPAWLDAVNPATLNLILKAATYLKKENGQQLFEQEADYQHYLHTLPKAAASLMGVFAETQQASLPLVLESMIKDRPFDQLEDLAQIKVPVLIIGNEDDIMHPFSMAESIHQAIPNSTLVKVVSRYIDNDQHQQEVLAQVQTFVDANL